jgi:hypothetical protein
VADRHYVIVLKRTPNFMSKCDDSTRMYSVGKFWSYFNQLITHFVGSTYIVGYDNIQPSRDWNFSYVTGLRKPNNDYDLAMLFGSQLQVSQQGIQDLPSLAIVFSDTHKPGDKFSMLTPQELMNIYKKALPKKGEERARKRYFSGHYFMQTAFWDAERILKMTKYS